MVVLVPKDGEPPPKVVPEEPEVVCRRPLAGSVEEELPKVVPRIAVASLQRSGSVEEERPKVQQTVFRCETHPVGEGERPKVRLVVAGDGEYIDEVVEQRKATRRLGSQRQLSQVLLI